MPNEYRRDILPRSREVGARDNLSYSSISEACNAWMLLPYSLKRCLGTENYYFTFVYEIIKSVTSGTFHRNEEFITVFNNHYNHR
jgi:hypothetical protein